MNHDLKYAIRSIAKNKTISAVKFTGLTTGVLAVLFLFQYISYELSFDKGFADHSSIYRITYRKTENNTVAVESATCPSRLAIVINDEVPEVESVARVITERTLVFLNNEKRFNDQMLFWVDSDFLSVFEFSFVAGDKEEALSRPHTAVLTKRFAEKFYGDADPLGKTIRINEGYPMEITGVIEDVRQNTHFHFDYLTSLNTGADYNWVNLDGNWSASNWYTYIKTAEGADPSQIDKKLKAIVAKHIEPTDQQEVEFLLQPVTDIHLRSDLTREIENNANIKTIYILALVLLGIVFVTWLNYFNLLSANVFDKDCKEWHIRKIQGANKLNAFMQNLTSNALLHTIVVLVSVLLFALLKPLFVKFTGKQVFMVGTTGSIVFVAAGIALLGTLVGALFQTFFVSVIKTGNNLKPVFLKNNKYLSTQKVFGVMQFTASLVFIMLLIGFVKQVQFMQNKDLGFDLTQTLVMPAPSSMNNDSTKRSKFEYLKSELISKGIITDMAASVFVPGRGIGIRERKVKCGTNEFNAQVFLNRADHSFLGIYKHRLIAGRNFGINEPKGKNIIINENFAEKIGIRNCNEAIGQQITINGNKTYSIIGVVKDSHYEGLSKAIIPMMLEHNIHPEDFGYYSASIQTKDVALSIKTSTKLWDEMYPNDPMNFFFADKNFNMQYSELRRSIRVFSLFTIVAILVSCVGIIGISLLTVGKRTKEIGIRKTSGAKNIEILSMLNSVYLRWVSIAFLASCPIAWVALHNWLQNFAYKTAINGWIFIVAGFATMAITLITVSWQSWRAAIRNPIDSLRYE